MSYTTSRSRVAAPARDAANRRAAATGSAARAQARSVEQQGERMSAVVVLALTFASTAIALYDLHLLVKMGM